MSDIKALHEKIEKQSEKMDTVVSSIHEVTLAIKENTLEHKSTKEKVDKLETEVDKLKGRTHTLEVAQAGDDARREIWTVAQKAAIGVIVAAIIGGALMMFYGGK